MKVLHVLQSDSYSGAENVVCQIISLLESDELHFVYASTDGEIRRVLFERGISHNLMRRFRLSELRRVIREEKPDVIHAHDMRAGFYAALCCGSIPLVSHVHNNDFSSRGLSLKSLLYYFAARKAKHIFWVSRAAYEGYCFHRSLGNKSTILHNVIDPKALEQKAELDGKNYAYDVVYLGRLTYPKHPERLLHVLELAGQRCPEMKAAIVGSGDLEPEIRQAVESNPKLAHVTCLGFSENPYQLLRQAKVMVMTSRWEGLPMTALEAMALGVPVVSTPVDGLAEIIIEGVNGYLSQDDECLAGHLVSLCTDDEERERLSAGARKTFDKINDLAAFKRVIQTAYEQ